MCTQTENKEYLYVPGNIGHSCKKLKLSVGAMSSFQEFQKSNSPSCKGRRIYYPTTSAVMSSEAKEVVESHGTSSLYLIEFLQMRTIDINIALRIVIYEYS